MAAAATVTYHRPHARCPATYSKLLQAGLDLTDSCTLCKKLGTDSMVICHPDAAPLAHSASSLTDEQVAHIASCMGRVFVRQSPTDGTAYFRGNCGVIGSDLVLTAAHILGKKVEPGCVFVLIADTLYLGTDIKNFNQPETLDQLEATISLRDPNSRPNSLPLVDVATIRLVHKTKEAPVNLASTFALDFVPPAVLTPLFRVAFLPMLDSSQPDTTMTFEGDTLRFDTELAREAVDALPHADVQSFYLGWIQNGLACGSYDSYNGVGGAMILNRELKVVGIHTHSFSPVTIKASEEKEKAQCEAAVKSDVICLRYEDPTFASTCGMLWGLGHRTLRAALQSKQEKQSASAYSYHIYDEETTDEECD